MTSLPAGSAARVLVLTRVGCHLCDDAIAVVADVCARVGATFDILDIDAADDPSLLAQYSDQVPVTFIDGAVHDFWRVDPVRFETALRTPR